MPSQTCLIAGPPGCGKTQWILNRLKDHDGPSAYYRFEASSVPGLDAGGDTVIDQIWLQDQIPRLETTSKQHPQTQKATPNILTLIEVQQFQVAQEGDVDAIHPSVKEQLAALNLHPERIRHFGIDPDLPSQDTLQFNRLEAWTLGLLDSVWDPNSLSSFWFELVNGAYGDVYRAKALMNLPDGRAFFCNWMVSQSESQFLPLQQLEPPTGRPQRQSQLVVQGKALNGEGIQTTIHDCLLSDEVLEMHQSQLREQPTESTTTKE